MSMIFTEYPGKSEPTLAIQFSEHNYELVLTMLIGTMHLGTPIYALSVSQRIPGDITSTTVLFRNRFDQIERQLDFGDYITWDGNIYGSEKASVFESSHVMPVDNETDSDSDSDADADSDSKEVPEDPDETEQEPETP